MSVVSKLFPRNKDAKIPGLMGVVMVVVAGLSEANSSTGAPPTIDISVPPCGFWIESHLVFRNGAELASFTGGCQRISLSQ